MRKTGLIFGFIFTFLAPSSFAQVEQNIVVEHFTNTRCGICASKNPSLFTNLGNHPNVMHLAVHPSRPYSSCELYKHNTTENDARTSYYNILGSTPRIVIQGAVMPSSTNFGGATIFDAYESKTSPFSLSVTTLKSDDDSLTARVVLKTEADHSFTSLQLYMPAVEDTLKYDAPNGEKEHYDVFRKVLLDETVADPSKTIGDTIVYMVRTAKHADWNKEQMYVMAIAQDPNTKEVIQAGQSSTIKSAGTSGVNELSKSVLNIYPNPVSGTLSIAVDGVNTSLLTITSVSGQVVYQTELNGSDQINTADWDSGIYFVNINSNSGDVTKRIVKI